MSIEILPDPQRPHGGGALLRLPASPALGTETTVSVYDRSRERWLGDKAWQPAAARFGPYPVRTAADGAQEVCVGSEIVDYIEEYTPLRLVVGAIEGEADWPDSIMYAPGSPPLGGILGGKDPEEPGLQGTFRGPRAGTQPPGSETPGTDDGDEEPGTTAGDDDEDEHTKGIAPPVSPPTRPAPAPKKTWLYVLLGLALLSLIAVAAWVLTREDPVPGNGDQQEDRQEQVSTPDPCSAESLAAIDSGYAEALAGLGACDPAVDSGLALGVLERGIAAGDGDALLAFGHLYDAEVTLPVIEEQIGLGFSDSPDIAARYYAQARDAGADGAEAALANICDRIAASDNPLTIETAAEYCQ